MEFPRLRRIACLALSGALAVFAGATRASADPLPAYRETLTLAADGSASLRIEIELPAGRPSPVLVPVQQGRPTNVTVRGLADATATPIDRDGEPYVSLAFDGPLAAASTVTVTCDVGRLWKPSDPALPHDNRRLTYRLLNLMGEPFGNATGTVVLPDGFVVTAVESVVPAVTESTSVLPYVLDVRDGRRTVTISRKSLAFGDDVEVTFRIARRGPPLILLLVLAALGATYLIRFRDLVRAT